MVIAEEGFDVVLMCMANGLREKRDQGFFVVDEMQYSYGLGQKWRLYDVFLL